ncbi:MAG: outer membrane protein assembly factor BamE [Sphingobacteriales bacterium]|nr:MAG: outer membrane protein assembly factor BamE [Sphingobacteriales bacterium]
MIRNKARLLISLVLVLSTISIIFYFSQTELPEKVTSANIRKVAPGMSLEQVIQILGTPLKVKTLYGEHINCKASNPSLDVEINKNTDIRKLVKDFIEKQKYCCDGNKEDIEQRSITLQYTRERIFITHPMLWIHLDSSYKVINVYAKRYEGGIFGDDPGIYVYGWEMDLADSTHIKYDYNKTKYWINETKFKEID